jgi:citronellol/citronellal dehydrogenase
MADAAYAIVTGPARQRTGQTLIDDEVLAAAGVTDLGQYAVSSEGPLETDLFL